MKSNLKVAFVALGLFALAATTAYAEGGRGDNDKSAEGTAIDFFGYFLAGANPFAAVTQIERDDEGGNNACDRCPLGADKARSGSDRGRQAPLRSRGPKSAPLRAEKSA